MLQNIQHGVPQPFRKPRLLMNFKKVNAFHFNQRQVRLTLPSIPVADHA
jgi:hypothetical protein